MVQLEGMIQRWISLQKEIEVSKMSIAVKKIKVVLQQKQEPV